MEQITCTILADCINGIQHKPPNLKDINMSPSGPYVVKDAYSLVNLLCEYWRDHINPVFQKDSYAPGGSIQKDSYTAQITNVTRVS